jgi:hypothetical protein
MRLTISHEESDERYRERFDALFERGASAVRTGSHYRDTPPVEGGRWGMSVVLVPNAVGIRQLAAITQQVIVLTGGDHWPTGDPAAVHFTVRAIEGHRRLSRRQTHGCRDLVPDDDPLAARCGDALKRAAAACRSVRLRLHGLTLTPSGVMLCAYPADAGAAAFAARIDAELAEDGWFERQFHRDIWYATLVHFTDAIEQPEALVEWVARRRDEPFGEAVFATGELVRFTYNGRQPVRLPLTRAVFGDAEETAAYRRDRPRPPRTSPRRR